MKTFWFDPVGQAGDIDPEPLALTRHGAGRVTGLRRRARSVRGGAEDLRDRGQRWASVRRSTPWASARSCSSDGVVGGTGPSPGGLDDVGTGSGSSAHPASGRFQPRRTPTGPAPTRAGLVSTKSRSRPRTAMVGATDDGVAAGAGCVAWRSPGTCRPRTTSGTAARTNSDRRADGVPDGRGEHALDGGRAHGGAQRRVVSAGAADELLDHSHQAVAPRVEDGHQLGAAGGFECELGLGAHDLGVPQPPPAGGR